MYLQLVVNAAQVKADGVDRDAEPGGGGLVVVSVDEETEQACLVRSQLAFGAVERAEFAKQGDHTAGHFG